MLQINFTSAFQMAQFTIEQQPDSNSHSDFLLVQTEKKASAFFHSFFVLNAPLKKGNFFDLKQKKGKRGEKICLTTTFSTKLDSTDMPDREERVEKKASCEKRK